MLAAWYVSMTENLSHKMLDKPFKYYTYCRQNFQIMPDYCNCTKWSLWHICHTYFKSCTEIGRWCQVMFQHPLLYNEGEKCFSNEFNKTQHRVMQVCQYLGWKKQQTKPYQMCSVQYIHEGSSVLWGPNDTRQSVGFWTTQGSAEQLLKLHERGGGLQVKIYLQLCSRRLYWYKVR